jgi:nucleoside 2-deoxyribosyltransferase
MTNPTNPPFVFVIMQFNEAWSDHYGLGIKPACEAAGASCARVDEQIFLESILDRIYSQIARADVIVAELTDRNPNVFYETGYAHGLGKPVILLTESADDIPFDLRHYPHVVHGGSIRTMKERLEQYLRSVLENPDRATAAMWRHEGDQEELARMSQHIENYLTATNHTMVSFETIRARVNATYSDEKLLHLIEVSPSRFRRARLRGDRPRLALVNP